VTKKQAGNRTTGEKKAAAGRKGRGASAFVASRAKILDLRISKGDPDLQKRIDLVVEMVKAREGSHSTDVMNEYRHVKHSTLKVVRVG
jgi:hypothetical protein